MNEQTNKPETPLSSMEAPGKRFSEPGGEEEVGL